MVLRVGGIRWLVMHERGMCKSPHRNHDVVGVFARTLYVKLDILHHLFEVEGGVGG